MNPTVGRMLKIGALPLLIYPFVAMASLMSLAGDDRKVVPLLLAIETPTPSAAPRPLRENPHPLRRAASPP